jgi:small-conductance mechanosensitive channel
MLGNLNISMEYVMQIAVLLIIVGVVLFAGYVIRRILFKRLSNWTQHSKSQIDDIIISSTNGPFLIWFLMLGIYLALKFSKLPENVVVVAGKILFVLGLLSVTLVLANVCSRVIVAYSGKFEKSLPGVSLTQNIARIIIFVVGILIILNGLGISITPILATLGVGGLAVALALQDTLSNLFAGIHIILNSVIRVGDYVKLETGEEGYVIDINWRTTKIRMLTNNVILVPNAKMVQTNITNYYFPEKVLVVQVNLGVHYNSDLKQVEKVTSEVAKQIMCEVPGGIPEFDPFIRYNSFGDYSIGFAVIMRAKEFADQYLIKHEFIKRLHERYNKEGIVIPYPINAVNYEQEGGKKPS